MKSEPCPHCGSPDKSKQCRYTWYLPYKEDYIKSGADRPCYGDEYADDELQKDRKLERKLVIVVVTVFVLLVLRMFK